MSAICSKRNSKTKDNIYSTIVNIHAYIPVVVSKNLQSAKLRAVERPLINRLKILMGPEKTLFDFYEAEILFREVR